MSDAPAKRSLRRLSLLAAIGTWLLLSVLLTVVGVGTLAPTIVIAVALAAAGAMRGPTRWLAVAIAAACLAIVAWRATLTPRADRPWMEDVSVMPAITVEGDRLTIEGLRNFSWRDGTAYDGHWETRHYALANLRGVDMILQPFPGSPLMAHTMLSFDFGPDGRVLLSIEARQEQGERYGPIRGGLNQFELIYLFMDERDGYTVRVMQGAELYAFPVRVGPLKLRAFFLSLCATAENLRTQPRFYKIIRDNCTTAWIQHSDYLNTKPVGLQIDSIFNGRIARLLHERGAMDTELTYDEAKARFRIDDRVLEFRNDPEFSSRIRGER